MKEEDMFLGNAAKKDGVISIIPVPYEGSCSHERGCADGPDAIIRASHKLETYNPETGLNTSEIGIRTLHKIEPEPTPEEMVDEIEAVTAKELLKKRFPVLLGGCHTITLGAVRALDKRFKDISVISFDAHADIKDEYDNSKLNHACIMSRVNEICPSVTVGVRSFDENEANEIKKEKNPVIFAEEIISGNKDWQEKAIKNLSKNVYITFDLDYFDISIMPATGTPEPGGPGWNETLEFLNKLCANKNIIGFDIVELKPIKNLEAYDFLVANLVYKIIGYASSGLG